MVSTFTDAQTRNTDNDAVGDDLDKSTGLFSLLETDRAISVDPALALRLYRGMLTIRIVDAQLMRLQRQGRISFYGEAHGQEATVIGTAQALKAGDWIVPALREAGVGLFVGMPLSQYIAQIMGNSHDNAKGRQMPCHPCDRKINYVAMSSCVSTQIPHAVGIAMAMKIAGDHGRAVIGYMGDGGTSEGDFHAALNFAAIFGAPVVLVCQNNQWAISTPSAVQTASPTIAMKGLGYGIESWRVDGNDVLAVHEVTHHALEKARKGGGPTFIEALTYRVSAHSSSDDPSRYRDESVTAEWRMKRDPLMRMRTWLMCKGLIDVAMDAELAEQINLEVRAAILAEETISPPPVASLVEDVYEKIPWHLEEQLLQLRGRHGCP